MRHRQLIAVTAALAAGALTLTACGSRDDKAGSTGDGGGTTVVIGVDAPLTGDLSALGLGIKNSADLAAKQANEKKYVKGVTFKIQALDDQAQASSGQQNATKLTADKTVLGVVGPLNSSVSESMQKVFDDAKLAQISPANTSPSLTQGPKWAEGQKVRTYKSYFRTATTDAIQGPFAAQYLFNKAGKKKVFIIDDKKTYGAYRRNLQGRVHQARRPGRLRRPHRPGVQGLLRDRDPGQELRRRRRLLRRRIPGSQAPSASRSRPPAPTSPSSAATA